MSSNRSAVYGSPVAGLLASLPHTALVVDADARIWLAAGNTEALLGRRPDELVGHDLAHLIPALAPRDRAGSPEADGDPGREVLARHRDGHLVHAEVTRSTVTVAGEAMVVWQLFGAAHEGARRRALRSSRERLFRSLDELPTGVLVIDDTGEIFYANRALLALIEPAPGDLIGLDALFVPAPDEGPGRPGQARPDPLSLALAGRRVPRAELHLAARSGPLPVAFSAEPIRDEAGEVRLVVAAIRDLTDERREQAALLAAEKLEALGNLAGGIARELEGRAKGVLDDLGFATDALATVEAAWRELEAASRPSPAPPSTGDLVRAKGRLGFVLGEIGPAVARAHREATEIAQVVSAIGDYARAGRHPLVLGDLNRIVERAATLSRSTWMPVADLRLALAPELPYVHCAVDDLEQVLLNLIVNAAHAIEDRAAAGRGLITLTTRFDAKGVTVDVTDDGGGIPQHHLGQLFDPAFTTKPVGRGTGKGLALVHEAIVTRHGGRVSIDTALGVGTTVSVHLPRNPARGDAVVTP